MKQVIHIINRIWIKIKDYLRGINLLTFMCFFIFATILWYGYSINSERERQLNIGVTYIGIPENIDFEKPLPGTFKFTVRDIGKRLRKYKEQTLMPLEIDLSSQFALPNGQIHINTDQVRSKISDQIQGTAKIQNLHPELIEINYFVQAQKQVPIKINGSINPAVQYYFTQYPTLSQDTITIYGKKDNIDTIQCVYTTLLNKKNIRDTFLLTTTLEPIEGVRFSTNTVSISASAEQFTEKTFNIKIECPDAPKDEKVIFFPSSAEVTVRLSLSNFNEVGKDDIHLICHYPEELVGTLPIEVEYSSPYINRTIVNPTKVEYIIEK